jgi:hypothetical protein
MSFEKIIYDVLGHQLQLFSLILKKKYTWPNEQAFQINETETIKVSAEEKFDDTLLKGIESILDHKIEMFARHLNLNGHPKRIQDYLNEYDSNAFDDNSSDDDSNDNSSDDDSNDNSSDDDSNDNSSDDDSNDNSSDDSDSSDINYGLYD